MTITALPTPPARTQAPATFITNADAFMAALPQFVTDANALAAGLNSIAAGGAMAIPYTFSTTITDADPGAGFLRLDNATQNTATTIRAELVGSDGSTWTSVIDTFDDSTNTIKGYIKLVKATDATKFLIFSVSALATPSGYRNITVANVASSSASPFANNDAIVLQFTRVGDVGATGATGPSTLPIIGAAGTVDAITATYSPAITLTNLQLAGFVSTGANTSTTPTFAPNGLTAHTITTHGGLPLKAGEIGPAGYVAILAYNLANTRWELLNPVFQFGINTVTNITSATTLTVANLAYHTVAMTAIGISVTLPDATTMSLGAPKAYFKNTGGYSFGIRDSSGTLLAAVAPGGTAWVSVDNIGSAAGSWSISGTNIEPGLMTIDNTYSSTYSTGILQSAFVALDNNTSIHLLGLTANGLAATVVDNTGKVLVTPVAIDAVYTGQNAQLFKVSATSALLIWYDNTNSKAVILTVSGSSPSLSLAVGTPVTLNDIQVAANGHPWTAPTVVALTSTLYGISYTNNASNAISVLALSVSGAVITQGSTVVITNTNPVSASTTAYALTATTFEVLYQTGTPAPFQINAVTVSVSGTTCTAGTPAGVAGVVSTGTSPTASCQLSPTKLFVLVDNNTTTVGIYTITISAGTTTAFSSLLSVETSVTGFASSNLAGYTANNANRYVPALFPLTSTTALLTYVDSAGVSRSVVITETGGTPTKGTIAFRSISQAAANAAGGGALLPQGTTEFCAIMETVASTAGYGFILNPTKINGSTLTVGTSKPAKNVGPNALNGTQFTSARLTSGDYVIFNSLNPQVQPTLPIFRSNGDVINYRGEISIPPMSSSAINYPIATVASNRIVLIGNQMTGNTIDKNTTDQVRLINVEIAA